MKIIGLRHLPFSGLRLIARHFGWLLRRFLRRVFRFRIRRILDCLHEMGIGHLQVVLLCNCPRIPQPGTHDVDRVSLGKFRLAGGTQIMPELWPGL